MMMALLVIYGVVSLFWLGVCVTRKDAFWVTVLVIFFWPIMLPIAIGQMLAERLK